MIDLGTVRPGSTIRIPFSSFDKDDGSSITMTNFAAADILVYKDGSTTERASTSGFTATTDFDSKTGKHLIVLDLSDNTTAGFWNAGSEYLVAVNAVTVDAVTTGGWVARFRIGYPDAMLDTTIATLSSQTSFTLATGPAEDDALNDQWAIIHDIASGIQCAKVLVLDYTGSTKTVTLAAGATFTVAAGDNISIMGQAPLQPTTLGRRLDVSSGGEAGIDWANVGSPTTTLDLSGTTISTSQAVASVSGAVGSVTGSVGSISGVTFPSNFASLGINASGHISRVVLCDTITTYTGDTPQTGDAYAIVSSVTYGNAALKTLVDDLPTNAELSTALAGADDAVLAAIAALSIPTVAEIADGVWDESMDDHTTSGTYGGRIVRATNSDVEVQITGAHHIAADVHEFQAGVITSGDFGTDAIAAACVSAGAANKIADHVRRRQQANVEASSDGDTLSLLSLYGFIQQAQESSASGGTLTVKKTDGTTTLGTRTLASSASADPITGVS